MIPPAVPHRAVVDSRALARWPRRFPANFARAALQPLVLVAARAACRSVTVVGADRLPAGPVVFAASHASHLDAPILLSSLPRRRRLRTAPAAAADYFYRRRAVGALVSLVMGAFPFPRRGQDGLVQARALLDQGWSVVLCPQGTRRGGPFRPGIGQLAAAGATVVPVAVLGTGRVLPCGRLLPRRAPVAVVFGSPMKADPEMSARDFTSHLEQEVARLGGSHPAEPVPAGRIGRR